MRRLFPKNRFASATFFHYFWLMFFRKLLEMLFANEGFRKAKRFLIKAVSFEQDQLKDTPYTSKSSRIFRRLQKFQKRKVGEEEKVMWSSEEPFGF